MKILSTVSDHFMQPFLHFPDEKSSGERKNTAGFIKNCRNSPLFKIFFIISHEKNITMFLYSTSRRIFENIIPVRPPSESPQHQRFLSYILKHRISISRYGDGEILLMEGYLLDFKRGCGISHAP